MHQKQTVIEVLNRELPSLIELFRQIESEFKLSTKYEIRSDSQNYQETFQKGQSNWAHLYLEPEILDLDLQLVARIMTLEWLRDLSIDEIKELNPLEFVTDKIDEIMPDINSDKAYEEYQEAISSDDEDDKFFAHLIIARFFNDLAYADHKESIPGLLYGLLKENKLGNIKKAVAIDPSIRYLPAVENYINNSSDYSQSILRGHIAEAMDTPFLINGKNQYSTSLSLFITALDAMRLLDGDIQLNIDEIYSLIKEYELQYVENNPDIVLEKPYLKKLVEQRLNNKVKESTINFDFLTT